MRHYDTPVEIHLTYSIQPVVVNVIDLAGDLLAEARRANERRLLAITGDRHVCADRAASVLDAVDLPIGETVAIADEDRFYCPFLPYDRTTELMGTTRSAVVLDLHPTTQPNVIGRAAGAVAGGGLLIVLCPPLEDWHTRRDAFDDGLVIEPYTIEAVRDQFKRRLVSCLGTHPGVAVVAASSGTIDRSGMTDPEPFVQPTKPEPSRYGNRFSSKWYERCVTSEQASLLETFETLVDEPTAIVVSAERGRGKSSAGGLAAAALAEGGATVGVTAPARSNVRAFFARVHDGLSTNTEDAPTDDVVLDNGGSVRYLPPLEAATAAESAAIEYLFVDEAAGLPVRTLERYLACSHVAFLTTRHGYEGSGHGFSTRFRNRLDELDRPVLDRHLEVPIRYAAGDPIESFVNRLLLLDARPPVDELVQDAEPTSASFVQLSPTELANNAERLREVMGLLATAHYRTEPDDLARVLDAPNLSVSALLANGHVVAVALLAEEGNLPADRVEAAYRGERLRGNMLPDLCCGRLRDDQLARQPGCRVVRIAVHPAVRRRGLGSTLLASIRHNRNATIEWLGTGFGATPGVVRFWIDNGFVPIAMSTSRNEASGSHSVIMLDRSITNETFADHWSARFRDRVRDSLSDVHRSVDPAVVSELLDSVPESPAPTFRDSQWRVLVAAADGPGRYDHDPGAARDLVLAGLTTEALDPRTRRLVIGKVLQGKSWESVQRAEGFEGVSTAKRALGAALGQLLDRYGPPLVEKERERLGK